MDCCVTCCTPLHRAIWLKHAELVSDGRGLRVVGGEGEEIEVEVHARSDFGLNPWEFEADAGLPGTAIVAFVEGALSNRLFGIRAEGRTALVVPGLERTFEHECRRAAVHRRVDAE